MSESYDPDAHKWLRRKSVTAQNPASMRTLVEYGEYGVAVLDEPVSAGGSGEGPSPLQSVLGALCGCESVTFRRTATDMDLAYESIRFDAAFTIDIRGRLGDRSVRPHFQSVRVRAIVTTDASLADLDSVITETEARCPVMNLLLDANVDLEIDWISESDDGLVSVPRASQLRDQP
ncbi:MAG TPA: OsmC family protein [Acidimicrobiales bacterium]|nr:OsmC family protein [Acidimicrobiales bacterium]